MSLPFYNWSRTAASNASADATVNWAEGQAPSSVNDSGRAMMASTAAFRDDIAGAITTGGTSTAYTVTSYQIFDTLAHLNGQMIGFVPNATNTNAVGVDITLNVDSLGAKPIRMQPSVALPGGTLILGTPYLVVYNNVDGVFYLQNMTNPYAIPLGGGIDYWGTTAPNSSFIFPIGQAISRMTYATAFTLFGTTYGSGDGSTTFNVPDKTGRVSAMKEASVTRMNANGWSGNSSVLGSASGLSGVTLTTNELPAHSHSVIDNGHTHTIAGNFTQIGVGGTLEGTVSGAGSAGLTVANATTGISINSAGSGNPAKNVQPTIICNYILRII